MYLLIDIKTKKIRAASDVDFVGYDPNQREVVQVALNQDNRKLLYSDKILFYRNGKVETEEYEYKTRKTELLAEIDNIEDISPSLRTFLKKRLT